MPATFVSVPVPTENPNTVFVTVLMTYAMFPVDPPPVPPPLVGVTKKGPHPVNAVIPTATRPNTAILAARPTITNPLALTIISKKHHFSVIALGSRGPIISPYASFTSS
jgi:hypothetical protein